MSRLGSRADFGFASRIGVIVCAEMWMSPSSAYSSTRSPPPLILPVARMRVLLPTCSRRTVMPLKSMCISFTSGSEVRIVASMSAAKRGLTFRTMLPCSVRAVTFMRLLRRIAGQRHVAGGRFRVHECRDLADDDVAAAGAERHRTAGVDHAHEAAVGRHLAAHARGADDDVAGAGVGEERAHDVAEVERTAEGGHVALAEDRAELHLAGAGFDARVAAHFADGRRRPPRPRR